MTPTLLAESFLTPDDLVYLVLALGAALVVGNGLALVRPPKSTENGELSRAPVARTAVMMAVGVIAAVWAIATLIVR